MTLDLLVVALYFAAIAAIGLWKGRGEKNLEGYALGNRSIPWGAILASILAAEISAATFLGAPGEGYALRNFTYLQLAIGTILARIIVGRVFVKAYYAHGVVSIYEFLGTRFGPLSRAAGSLVFLLTRTLASGTRLYVAAVPLVLAIEIARGHAPGAGEEVAIYLATVVGLTALTALYTAAGGIKAVVWTDLIQAVILVLSLAVTLTLLLGRIPGGWPAAHRLLHAPGDLHFFDTGILPGAGWAASVKNILQSDYTLFSAFFASTCITLATHGTDQDMVQRMLTGRDARSGGRAVLLSGLADAPIVFAFLLIGILLWVFYQLHPDPGLPKENVQIFAYFILTQLPAGLRGLLLAALLATAMGSLSTALNALATSFCRDFYLPGRGLGDRQTLRVARLSTLAFAAALSLVGAGTAYAVVHSPDARILPIVLGVFGYTYGSLLGIFLIALFTKTRGNDTGNLIAMACGFVAVAFLSGLIPFPHPAWMPVLAFPWRIFFGTAVTVAVALLFPTSPGSRAPADSPAPEPR